MAQDNAPKPTHTFRGRSMQEAVAKLKRTLGPSAVIVSTRRGRDQKGGFVEITANPESAAATMARTQSESPATAAPVPKNPAELFAQNPAVLAQLRHAMGGAKGASAAYARTALTTQAKPKAGPLANMIKATAGDNPFGERAAWLARQIEERQMAEVKARHMEQISHRNPPYHAVGENQSLPSPASTGGSVAPDMLNLLAGGALPEGATAHPVSNQFAPAPVPIQAANPVAVETTHHTATQSLPEVPPTQGPSADATTELEALRREVACLKSVVSAMGDQDEATDESADLDQVLNPLQAQIIELRALLERAGTEKENPASRQLREKLIEIGLAESYAHDLSERVLRAIPGGTVEDGDVMALVGQMIGDDLPTRPAKWVPGARRRVMAFVGPTGVGKTTTIVKVASQAALSGLKVGLVTVDTFRMGAVEQLAKYAEVLDAPLRVVKDPAALPETLDSMTDCDLVLVDTNGRNPRVAEHVSALKTYFPAGWGGEIVLTVACNTRERDLFEVIDGFAPMGYDRICVTKTDETSATGTIYTVTRRAGRPLTWITDGPGVPDDIEDADPFSIAQRVVADLAAASRRAMAS